MEDLSVHVMHGFEVKPKRIVKEKSYYICHTDKGIKVIRKCMDGQSHILFQHEIKEQLNLKGFTNVDRFALSKNSKPFFEHEDNVYIMTNLSGLRDSNFQDNRDFERIVAEVAKFHKTARNLEFSSQITYGNEQIPQIFRKQIAQIDAIKKTVGQTNRLSDFDVLFLKNYHSYREQMQEATILLEKNKFYSLKDIAREQKHICHNLLKEESVLFGDKNAYITSFSSANVDCQIFDLCSIIQRYSKNFPRPHFGIYEILSLYDKINTLSREDVEVLYPLLKFPNKFVQICLQYYSKKRSWIPSAILSRMQDIVQAKPTYDSFIESLQKE